MIALRKLLISALLVSFGCATARHDVSPTTRPSPARMPADVSVWESIDSGRFRMQIARVGAIPNTGLQLPVASPDGRWIAALASADVESVDPDAPITGQTIAGLTLMLFDLSHPQLPPRLVARGAAWPIWSADSQRLIAVAYDKNGHCGLIIHDVSAAQTRRLEVGVDHIVTPSLSPSGTTLAFAGFNQIPQQARLFVYQLEQRSLTPLAAPKDMIWQISPAWISDSALIYFGRVGTSTGLYGTSTSGSTRDALLSKLALPGLASDAIRAGAGIAQSRSKDGEWLATFDPAANHIALTRLDDASAVMLPANSQAGLWMGSDGVNRFIFTTDKDVQYQSPTGDPHTLAAQQMLPLWCSPGGSNLLFLAPGQQRWTFDLLRLHIDPAP